MLNRLQSREETFFKEGGVDVPENEEREQLLEVRHFQFCSCSCFEYFEFGPQIFFQVLGYYWHLQHHLGKALREGLDKVRVFLLLLDIGADRISSEYRLDMDADRISSRCLFAFDGCMY